MTNSSDGIKALLLGKTGKKLVAFSLGVFLLIAVLVFSAALSYYRNIILVRMDDHLGDIPRIVDSCKKELALRSRVYEADVLAELPLGQSFPDRRSAEGFHAGSGRRGHDARRSPRGNGQSAQSDR